MSNITSLNHCITINADDNVTIDNGKVIFNEFNQAVINLSYVPQIARAKTAFLVEDNDNIVQCSFRNDIIPTGSASIVLFTGGVATLLLQSQVGRTGNIGRGIVGALNRRPTGSFSITVRIFTSEVSSGRPTKEVDSLVINGTIRRLFNDNLQAKVTQDGAKLNYLVQLGNTDSIVSSPYLYGYKISNIGNGISIKKGSTTVRNGDIFQVSNTVSGGVLELKSTGSENGNVSFNVTAVDLDKKDRDANVSIDIFSFENIGPVVTFPNMVDYVAPVLANPSANPPVEEVIGVDKIVGFQPWKTESDGTERLQTNMANSTSNNLPIADTSYTQAIWSASARSSFDERQQSGKVKFSFGSGDLPVTDSLFIWKVIGYDLSGNLANIVKVNGVSMVSGIVTGSSVFNVNNPDIVLLVSSELYASGTFNITCQVKHNLLTQNLSPIIGNPISSINLRLIKNDPEAGAENKRVYLFDNTIDYTMDSSFDDRDSWNSKSNPVDNSGNSIITKFISDSSKTKFNLNYADSNSLANSQFVGANGNLGIHIKWSTLTVTLPSSADYDLNTKISSINSNLKLAVNPNTWNKLIYNGTINGRTLPPTFIKDSTGTKIITTYFDSNGIRTKTQTIMKIGINGNQATLNEIQIPSVDVITTVPLVGLTPSTTETNTYDIADNNMSIRPNGFYGRIRMHYKITELSKEVGNTNTYESYNWGNSSIYVMPRPNPIVVSLKRQLETFNINNVSQGVTDTNRTSFSMADFVRYRISIKNGDNTDYDYTDQTQQIINTNTGTIGESQNIYITDFLKKNQELRIKYVDAVANLKINDRLQTQSTASSIVKYDEVNSLFNSDTLFKNSRNTRIDNNFLPLVNSEFGITLSNFVYSAPGVPTYQQYVASFDNIILNLIDYALADGILPVGKSRIQVLANIKTAGPYPVPIQSQHVYNASVLAITKQNEDFDLVTSKARYVAGLVKNAFETNVNSQDEISAVAEVKARILVDLAKLPYKVYGFDTLNWLDGNISVGEFDIEPPVNGEGSYESWITIKFTSVLTPVNDINTPYNTISVYASDNTVVRNLNCNMFSILNVPIAKGFEMNRDCSLITGVSPATDDELVSNPIATVGSLDVATCTTVVIKNIGLAPINVNVNDINLGTSGNQALYLSSSNSECVIGAGKAKVFIRIMYSPEAWEPMNCDY